MQIRPYTPADLAQTEAVFQISRRATFYWADPEYFARASLAAEIVGEELTVAATEQDLVVGFVSVYLPDRFVHHLFVLPDYQRQGLGRQLLTAAMEARAGSWRLKCAERNTSALAFYERLGWRPVGSGASALGAYRVLESPPPA